MVDALPTPAPNVRTGLRTGIFAQIWRRRWIFTGTLLLTLCAVAGLVVTLQVRYSASGSVIVAEQEPGAAAASAAWVQKLGDPADLESQLLLIRSSRMLRLALARPGVVEAIQRECAQAQTGSAISKLLSRSENPCAKLLPDSDALLDWAGTRYSVSSVGRSRVIAIAYQSGVPETARDVANALIQAYLEDQRAVTANSRETTAAWLWQEVAQIDAALRDEEARIQAFRRANGLVRGQLAPISSERLTSINQQLSIAQAAQAEAAARLQEMQRGRATPGDSRAVLDSRAVADVKQQLASTAAQIASASETLGPNHPTLAALRRQRDELQARIGSEASSISTSAVRAYAAAGTQVATLQRQLDAMKQEVGSASDNEAEIASMVRGVEIMRALYVDLYKRASDLETERRVLVGSTRLVSLAELPSLPSFPKRMPFAAAGLTLALVLATVAAMLRDLADRSVRAAGGVETTTGIPVFAQIPRVRATGVAVRIPGRKTGPGLIDLLAAAQRSPIVQDSLRGLHARLVLAGIGGRRRSVLVTSASPREGKTFTTLALAQLVATSGRRVLVIECDLRCPTFATALNLSSGPGLGDVLRGFASPKEAITRTSILTLDAIPAGPPCADSTELLMSSRMAELLLWAENYDLVLLDSPPSEVLMDARVLAKLVDGVLLCTRWGETMLSDLGAAVDGIRASGGYAFGAAVTMVEPKEHALYDARPVRSRAYMVQQ